MDSINDTYGLHPKFELVVLWYCTSQTKFWSRVGHQLEIAGFTCDFAKPILQACQAIAKETGQGPNNATLVLQRMQTQVMDGKLTARTVSDIYDLIEAFEDGSPPNMEAVVTELVPVVRQRMQKQAMVAGHQDFAKGGDFTATMGLLDSAHRLGHAELASGTQLNKSGFDVIRQAQTAAKIPLGVMELDLGLGNGQSQKTLLVWIGEPGAGKSQALCTGAGEAIRQQHFTGVATLELPEAHQLARIYGNLTGIPVNDIIELEPWQRECERRMEMIQDQIGICEVAEFAPHATTVSELLDWKDDKEQKHGQKMTAMFVDYADKLHHPGLRNSNEYEVMRYVYEGLRRDIAVAHDMWVATASQATRPSRESQKRLDLHHVADSMHKVRVADLVITMTRDEETDMMEFFVAKNRLGKSRFSVGPLMTHFECARMVPVMRELSDWKVP